MTRILAIDDKTDNIVALSALLRNLMPGCSVITAQSGREGIAKARSELPEVILLDVKMPDMDGFETCRRLKSDGSIKHIPVIMITAIKTDPRSRIKGLEIGADAFLAKPIDPYELVSQINVALRIKKAEDALREERDSLERLVADRTAALKEREARFRSLVESTSDWIWAIDAEGRYCYASPKVADFLGYKADEVIGKTPFDFMPPQEAERVRSVFKEIVDARLPFKGLENHNIRKSGEPVVLETSGVPIFDAAGKFAGYQGVDHDITERKQAENALRESEEKFRNFTEQSFVGFYLIQDDRFKYVNPKFADIFGYSVDECLDNMQFRQLVHPEDLATVQEQVRRRVAGETKAVQYTFKGMKKTGETIHVEIYGSALLFEGKPAAIGTMLDISQKLELENRLAQSHRMESIGSLAGGIAHDFNNLLFPIVGMSEMLIEDFVPGSPEHERAQVIFHAGMRGSDLVKQILAFSRQSEHKKMPIRLQQVLKEVIKLARSTIPADIKIVQNISTDCGLVNADPTQVHQIAMNLITNAYHAVETNGGKISVSLKETVLERDELVNSSFEPGNYTLLSVADTGCGIKPDMIGKIFEPYFTTKELGKGTGLGLAVVYGIIKEHGGKIVVRSKIGAGTKFDVYLPLMVKSVEQASAEAVKIHPTGTERILLVDDEEAIVKLEKQMLARLGYRVTTRISSLEALNAFKANPDAYDLFLTDMTMPNMTGDQLAKEVIRIRPGMPVIICTGFSERVNQERADAIGVKGFLMKPVIKAEMAQMVRKVLDEVES